MRDVEVMADGQGTVFGPRKTMSRPLLEISGIPNRFPNAKSDIDAGSAGLRL
jgi:hypothetical protein